MFKLILKRIGLILKPYKRDKDVSKAIWFYYVDYNDDLTIDRSTLDKVKIHDILVRKSKNTTYIQIVSERCGLIIGKYGASIDALKLYLEEELETNVVVELKEFDLWLWTRY